MRISENGFFPWLFWALFKWNGTIDRVPYAGALLSTWILSVVYMLLVGMFCAHVFFPPPEGVALDAEYILQVLRSGGLLRLAPLPVAIVAVLRDAKRLRSMGAFPWIAAGMALLDFIRPDMPDAVGKILGLAGLAYLLILLLMPSRNAAGPARRGFPARPGDGDGPRRMSGKELTNWRQISPAPRQTPGETPEQEQSGGEEKKRE